MDEFDFEEDADSPESPSRSKSSSIKKCPQSPSNSSISVSSSGSPLRGWRKNRKTRKVILSGAQAIKEGKEKRRQAEQDGASAAAAVNKAAALEKKKRAAASTPSSNSSEDITRQSSLEKKVNTTKGRRHKLRKMERNNNNNTASVDREISTDFACSQSSLDSKSVRFAESSKGKQRHDDKAERYRESGESESSSSGSSSATGRKSQQTQQQPSSCLRTKPIYPPSSSQSTRTNASKHTPPTSPASNSTISYSSFARIHGNGARKKKRHKPRRFQLGYSPNDSSHPNDSSVNSSPASSSSSSKSPEKTQAVTLGRSIGYSSRDFDTTPDAAAAAQNAGNYRMLIDELSYLCSAILHCKQQRRIGFAKIEVVCKHNSITAGAACDIGELISQSGTRTALMMLSSSSGGRAQQNKSKNGGKSVGALGAILEALACAPPVVDWVDVCKEVIIGVDEENDLKPSSLLEGSNATTGFELDNNNLAAVCLSSSSERTKFDSIASKALSIVSLFVSIDCTGSSRAAITPSCKMERNMIKGARNNILQHQQSLRGIARLISDDPVVNTYLKSVAVAQGVTGLNNDGDEMQLMDNVDEGSIASKSSRASTLSSISMSKASSQQSVDELSQSQVNNADPTKSGRQRNRKRKKMMAIREVDDEQDSEFNMPSVANSKSSESPTKSNSPAKSGKSNCLDFNSPDSSSAKPNTFVKKVRLNSVEKYTEKLTLALSRAKIPTLDAKDENNVFKSDDDKDLICQHCQVWGKETLSSNACITSASLAIDAAEYIITGKDSSSGNSADDADMDEDDDDSDDDDFLVNGNQNPDDEVSSKNPILFANEMLRKSGSLPDYSRAYASTLSAILLAHKSHHAGDQSQEVPSTTCHRCITYLQKRASSLSGVIDSLCCLSPKASIALSCPETYLVPGLLKVVADLSFGGDMGTASTSIRDEILTSLKTLTSLTHENSVACEQLVRPHNWDNSLPISMENVMNASDQTTTGVCIIFSYLLKVASTKQGNTSTNYDDEKDKSIERYLYDTTIFCLNILTNIVEMVPHSAKYMIEHITVNDEGVNAITWLSRWVVSTTYGFRNSIMKGSFGSQGETDESTTGGDELKAGEEGNLVTAGNGFVLLAYLMLEDEHSSSSSASIRDAVIKELPFDESGASGGIQYMIKTLKAFCNFYHYSVGDLSVAVIAPIVKLISGLQKLDVVEQRKTWL